MTTSWPISQVRHQAAFSSLIPTESVSKSAPARAWRLTRHATTARPLADSTDVAQLSRWRAGSTGPGGYRRSGREDGAHGPEECTQRPVEILDHATVGAHRQRRRGWKSLGVSNFRRSWIHPHPYRHKCPDRGALATRGPTPGGRARK